MSGPTVVLVEPRPLVREAVAESLTQDHGVVVAAVTEDLGTTLLQSERVQADVVVISQRLSGPLAAFCERLHQLDHPPRVLVADAAPDEHALLHAIESGADGYSSGAQGLKGLVEAINAIARGESVVPAAMLGPLLRRLIQRQREAAIAAERLVALTRREREVLSLLVDGLDQEAIAQTLYISPETARTHLQRLLRKLDVHSRAEAVALVAQTGLADRLERIVERSA